MSEWNKEAKKSAEFTFPKLGQLTELRCYEFGNRIM